MNVIEMHNLVRTFLDEHRTVRLNSDDIDDVINYCIRDIINESIESDASEVKSKFEAVGKIRNELYPLLKTEEGLPSIATKNGLPVSEFPAGLRQIIRVSARVHKIGSSIVTDTVDGTDTSTGVTRVESTGAFGDVSAGDVFACDGRYYLISSVDGDYIYLECLAHSGVAAPVAFEIFSTEDSFLESVDYVTRNEYKHKIKKDPFQKPVLIGHPKRLYYFLDSYGMNFTIENSDYTLGVVYIDYLKEPTAVQGGINYGPEEDAGAVLPAVAGQNYISITESKIGVNYYQPGETMTLASGTVAYGAVAHNFTNCDLPDSLHEDIVRKATVLIGSVPERDYLIKLLQNNID